MKKLCFIICDAQNFLQIKDTMNLIIIFPDKNSWGNTKLDNMAGIREDIYELHLIIMITGGIFKLLLSKEIT